MVIEKIDFFPLLAPVKILMVSIASPHFFNWTEQLKASGHEIYWFDIFDSNHSVVQIDFTRHIQGWRYRFNYPGRYKVKKYLPRLNNYLNRFNERQLLPFFEKKLAEIRPDVVHSFALHLACSPILPSMIKNPGIKWIYSSWGSDLFYYSNEEKAAHDIENVMSRVEFMFSDCRRDFTIAKNLGFSGEFLGVFPGGGGFDHKKNDLYLKPHFDRENLIVIKGFQGKHGKCTAVLEALVPLRKELESFKIVVFGADQEVIDFSHRTELKHWGNLTILGRIPKSDVIQLLGGALIYIGNSLSDGMPNTFLEAICLGAFPIQSNPGGATAELIRDKRNGLLIENPANTSEVKKKIKWAVGNGSLLASAVSYNLTNLKPALGREIIKKQVLERYDYIEKQL